MLYCLTQGANLWQAVNAICNLVRICILLSKSGAETKAKSKRNADLAWPLSRRPLCEKCMRSYAFQDVLNEKGFVPSQSPGMPSPRHLLNTTVQRGGHPVEVTDTKTLAQTARNWQTNRMLDC